MQTGSLHLRTQNDWGCVSFQGGHNLPELRARGLGVCRQGAKESEANGTNRAWMSGTI